MDQHFVYTGGYFGYLYYLSVISALKTQVIDKVNIWATEEPKGKYFNLIEGRVQVKEPPIDIPEFPALQDKPQGFKIVHIKDYIEWAVLHEFGGVFMDLDVFSLKDISYLLDDKEAVATPHLSMGMTLWMFNNAIIVAKAKSVIVKEAFDMSVERLAKDDINWGDTGPAAWTCSIFDHFDKVIFPKYGVFGNILTSFTDVIAELREDGALVDGAHTIHLYGASNKAICDGLSPTFIACSKTPFARAVRETLTEDQWNIE